MFRKLSSYVRALLHKDKVLYLDQFGLVLLFTLAVSVATGSVLAVRKSACEQKKRIANCRSVGRSEQVAPSTKRLAPFGLSSQHRLEHLAAGVARHRLRSHRYILRNLEIRKVLSSERNQIIQIQVLAGT